MSDKPRRDITLGEMQDECKRRGGFCEGSNFGLCDYGAICKEMHHNGVALSWKSPLRWGLTDPPRFNEEQMALLKALLGVGCNKIVKCYGGEYKCSNDAREVFNPLDRLLMQEADLLDLAELLGKDGAE